MTSSIDFNWCIFVASRQGLFRKDEVLDRYASAEMFLNDALKDVRSDGVIPDTIRIHYRDGTFFADSQAVCFGAVNAVLAFIEIQFL